MSGTKDNPTETPAWIGPINSSDWLVPQTINRTSPTVLRAVLNSVGIPTRFKRLPCRADDEAQEMIYELPFHAVYYEEEFLGMYPKPESSQKTNDFHDLLHWMQTYIVERGLPVCGGIHTKTSDLRTTLTAILQFRHKRISIAGIEFDRCVAFYVTSGKSVVTAKCFHTLPKTNIVVQTSGPVGLIEHNVWGDGLTLNSSIVSDSVKNQFAEIESVLKHLANCPYKPGTHFPHFLQVFGAPECPEKRMSYSTRDGNVPYFVQAAEEAQDLAENFAHQVLSRPVNLLDLFIYSQKIVLDTTLSRDLAEGAEMMSRLSGRAANQAADILKVFTSKMAFVGQEK